jgi:hypothetical protein
MEDKTPAPFDYPKSGPGDTAHALARAALGTVPVLGAAAAELFALAVTPTLERRRVEWMEHVAERLYCLEHEGRLRIPDLVGNEQFVDVVTQASQAALRTSQVEKREALRNAVCNSVLPNAPDPIIQALFVAWVDQYTVLHLRVLAVFDDPMGWFGTHRIPLPIGTFSAVSAVLEAALPELERQPEIYRQVWRDLSAAGFVGGIDLNTTMTATGATERRSTEIGRQFLRFIQAPAGEG